MADNDKPYDLYGKLPDAWLVTLRVDKQGIASCKAREKREAPADIAELAGWTRLDKAPRPFGIGLPCTGISLEWQREDGMWRCEWDYEGASDPSSYTFGDPATTTHEIDCSVTTAPVQAHPRFLEIAKQYGVGPSQFDKKTGEFLGFPRTLPKSAADGSGDVKNPLYGFEDLYVSTLVWRVSSSTRELPADFRKNLGLIDTPRNQGGPSLPAITGKQNWLKTVARATWRGNIWSTQEEWALSGKDGWNRDFYRSEG